MNRRDWLLLAVAAAEDEGLDPVQLQKSLFLLGEKRKQEVGPFYEFEPHNYGPFSKDIYAHATALVDNGYLTKEKQPSYSWSIIRITEQGRRAARTLRREAPEEALAYLERAVDWVKGQSFYDLVRSIYRHFPEYRTNSIFRE